MTGNRTKTLLALHSASADGVALCAAAALLPEPAEGGEPPEWIRLLPAGQTLTTADGRGPYKVGDHPALVARSLQQEAMPMVIDENHATDHLGARGESAPARGWITALEARADGVWGKVEWTPAGRQLMAEKAYRFISPVIRYLKDGTVLTIARASLVNAPNLRGMTALHKENDMNLLDKLLAALGLPATATEESAIAAVTALHAERANASTALQAALDPIAAKLGLSAGADQAAVLAGVETLKTASPSRVDDPVVTALQAEIGTLAAELKALKDTGTRTTAEAYVDGEIKRGRVGLKVLRDDYVALHMEDPARAQKLIAGMPVLGGGGQIVPATPPAREGEIALQAEQLAVARMLGQDPKDYAETLKAERTAEAAL